MFISFCDWYLDITFSVQKYFLKIYLFFKKTKIELLTFAQIELLCDFLHNRFGSHLRLVSVILGDPRITYSMAPYTYHKTMLNRK